MEYSIEQLDAAILYYLSTNANIAMSIKKIYNDICEEKICPDLYDQRLKEINKIKFTTICHTMDSRFTNLHKYFSNGTLYLMFSTRNKDDVLKSFFDNTNKVDEIANNQMEVPEYCDIIKFALDNPQHSAKLKFDDYMDGTNTVLHIICINKRHDLLKKLLESYDVNTNIMNKDQKTPFDLLSDDKSTVLMMRELSDYNLKKNLLALEITSQKIRTINSDLVRENIVVTDRYNNISKQIDKLKTSLFYRKIIVLPLLVLNLYQLYNLF
jgi:hypothetical protein